MNLNNNNKNNENKRNRYLIAFIGVCLALLFFLPWIAYYDPLHDKMRYVSYSDLLDEASSGNIESIKIYETTFPPKALASFRNGIKAEALLITKYEDLIKECQKHKAKISAGNPEDKYNQIASLIPMLFAVGLIILLLYAGPALFGSGNSIGVMFGVAKKRREDSSKIKFDDVCGIDDIKNHLQEIVHFLIDRDRFSKVGAKVPKGILLTGEPGVGKTMLAKALANEADAHFLAHSASEFVEMYVGMGAKRVRDIFRQASEMLEKTECVVIFIDEIDAVGAKREGFHSHPEREQTLNQLLVELDGFDSNSRIIVIAATNRPDSLDPALTRAGRFDLHLHVPLPSLEARRLILFKKLDGITTDLEGINTEYVIKSSAGLSGADLASIVNQAALDAARSKQDFVTTENLNKALEEKRMGKPSALACSEEDKKRTAHHEAGHAIMIIKLTDPDNPTANPDPIFKGTMIPRGGALGYVSWFPRDEYDKVSITKAKYLNHIAVALGGKVAEEIIYGEQNTSSGASSDIQAVTNIAYQMVTNFGFTEKLGHFNPEIFVRNGLGNMSSSIQEMISLEAQKIIEEQYQRVKLILTENIQHVYNVAKAMLSELELTGAEIEQIVNTGSLEGYQAHKEQEKQKYIYFNKGIKKEKNSENIDQNISKTDAENAISVQAQ